VPASLLGIWPLKCDGFATRRFPLLTSRIASQRRADRTHNSCSFWLDGFFCIAVWPRLWRSEGEAGATSPRRVATSSGLQAAQIRARYWLIHGALGSFFKLSEIIALCFACSAMSLSRRSQSVSGLSHSPRSSLMRLSISHVEASYIRRNKVARVVAAISSPARFNSIREYFSRCSFPVICRSPPVQSASQPE